jgi:hypothetical protein
LQTHVRDHGAQKLNQRLQAPGGHPQVVDSFLGEFLLAAFALGAVLLAALVEGSQ